MDKRFRERPENGLLMTNNGRSRKEPTVFFAPAVRSHAAHVSVAWRPDSGKTTPRQRARVTVKL